ncbi:MAG: hypothetical protein ABSB91_07670, partial [Sedimentisphaerales bacterium]
MGRQKLCPSKVRILTAENAETAEKKYNPDKIGTANSAVKEYGKRAMQTQDPIIEQLEKNQVIDKATLETALAQQRQTGESLISILKKGKLLNDEQLARVIAAAHNIEFIELTPDMIDPMMAHLLMYEMVSKYNVIAVRKDGRRLI